MKTKQQKRLEAIERLERAAESRYVSREKAASRRQEALRLRIQFGCEHLPLLGRVKP